MGLFGTKEKNYDMEIALLSEQQALLNEKQNALSERTDKNNSDVIALGLDFTGLKSSIGEEINKVWDFVKHMNSDLAEFKAWKNSQEQENKATEKAKSELPDTLTYKEICDSLEGFNYLDQTSLKYYLYENDILDLKINRVRNTYKISDNFGDSNFEIKKYIHVTDGVITFSKDVLEFLVNNSQDLQNSIDRYIRKQKQFNESKQHLSEVEIKNFQKEIGQICGVGNNYDKNKWKMIYKRYEDDHKDWLKKYDLWTEKFLQEHPNYKYDKPSRIMYLVKEAGDGDVLLKIACELFVV